MSTELLNKLLVSEIPEIREAALRANELTAKYNIGQITKEEYQELMDDLINLDKIDQSMITIEVYREIREAFNIIATLKAVAAIV